MTTQSNYAYRYPQRTQVPPQTQQEPRLPVAWVVYLQGRRLDNRTGEISPAGYHAYRGNDKRYLGNAESARKIFNLMNQVTNETEGGETNRAQGKIGGDFFRWSASAQTGLLRGLDAPDLRDAPVNTSLAPLPSEVEAIITAHTGVSVETSEDEPPM